MLNGRKSNLIESLAGLIRAVTGFLVLMVILAGVGWIVVGRSRSGDGVAKDRIRTRSIPKPVDWSLVDAEIVVALQGAREAAEAHAAKELDVWAAGLMKRVDEEFLGWFFGYFNQQVLGIKGLWGGVVHWWDNDRPTAAERLTEGFQAEFAKRVLRPQVAQLEMERIAQESVDVYANSLRASLAVIPEKYNVPRPDWDRHLRDMAMIAEGAEGNRQIALTMKTFTVSTVASAVVLGKFLQGSFRRIATKVSGKMSTRLASRTAGKMATKTGGKVGAKLGGRFLGPIIGAGIILWDIYDHHRTKKIEEPILRKNIQDYLDETKYTLLHDQDTGVLAPIHQIEGNVLDSLRQVASAEETTSHHALQ